MLAALGAGFIAGMVLLLVPRGSPWASITFFSAVAMGRPVPPGVGLPLPVVWAIHLGVSIIYGLIVSWAVSTLSQGRAILAGGAVGLFLNIVNVFVVTFAWPLWRGNEGSVLFTHIVFGLIAGGAYRGLLRRRPPAAMVPPTAVKRE